MIESSAAPADNPIRRRIASILSRERPSSESYAVESDQGFVNLTQALSDLERLFRATEPVLSRRPTLNVSKLYGAEGVAVPWINFTDERVTRLMSYGVFVLLLFRKDNAGIYLTLNQGVVGTTKDARRGLAERLRPAIGFVRERGLALDNDVQLGSTNIELYERYGQPAIARKFYPSDALPADDEPIHDLEVILRAYDQYIATLPAASAARSAPIAALRSAMSAASLSYTPSQLATFCTALQTKGFVILSGISGAGKTKLVQAFAALLREPHLTEALTAEPSVEEDAERDGAIFVPYQGIMLSQGHINLKQSLMRDMRLTTANATQRMPVYLGGQMVEGRLDLHRNQGPANLHLTIRDPLRKWLREQPLPDGLWLTPDFDADGALASVRLSRSATAFRAVDPQASDDAGASNTLFLSVRPDWRDSKSLLGYFNPLTQAYQETDFLRFIQRAAHDYRTNGPQASPWFVVLDEMNLAHVEYYFADLLSVLESGRDADGWTREQLRLGGEAAPEGDAPADLALPPNLYIVGTVNIDETTHAFSPKVLDRAFSIELTEVNFRDYPPAAPDGARTLTDDERHALLAAFTRHGRFARLDKRELADYISHRPEARDWLQALNERLAPRNLHFGYRVFDEIVAFLAAAGENGLFEGLGARATFDAAVLMKVLPKFHGSRGKLEGALLDVLGWCADPAAPAMLSSADAEAAREYALPRTAARVRRMLDELRVVGFTAFG